MLLVRLEKSRIACESGSPRLFAQWGTLRAPAWTSRYHTTAMFEGSQGSLPWCREKLVSRRPDCGKICRRVGPVQMQLRSNGKPRLPHFLTNHFKSNQIWIEITLFRMIWFQTKFRLVQNQLEMCKYNLNLVIFNKIQILLSLWVPIPRQGLLI